MRDSNKDLTISRVVDTVVTSVDCPYSLSGCFVVFAETAHDFGGDLIDKGFRGGDVN